MSNLEGYIGCVPWGAQELPSVKRVCAYCEAAIALSKTNALAAKKMVPMCVPCLLDLFPESLSEGVGLVGGKTYVDFSQAIRAALAERDRN